MKELSIDLETFSSVDLEDAGVHRYTESPDFEILLLAYSIDRGPVNLVDLARGQKVPKVVEKLLFDSSVKKTAYNAAFEISCLSAHFSKQLPPEHWVCTQALAAQAGLPFGLDRVATILGTEEQKDKKGKDLIRFFCVPCTPTKTNGMRVRNFPEHAPDKWEEFCEYCRQDVRTELSILNKLSWFDPGDFERLVWHLDQKINNRGVMIDKSLVENAIRISQAHTQRVMEELRSFTGLENPNSDSQFKDWIFRRTGVEISTLNKTEIDSIKERLQDPDVSKALDMRAQIKHAAVKKYVAMLDTVNEDNRIRGLFRYYGANKTGRFSSRKVQLQNLKRNSLTDLDFARSIVKKGDIETLRLCYHDLGEVLGNLVRTAFVPSPGMKLYVSDLSAIEARVLAWLAGESWKIEVFETHGKIYEASAAMMFKIPIENVDGELRRRGKVSELALGYQGWIGAFKQMGADKMGLSEDEMKNLILKWRKANPNIVRYWGLVAKAAVMTIQKKKTHKLPFLEFHIKNGSLLIQLPSGRSLVYNNAKAVIGRNEYTGESTYTIAYQGVGDDGRWTWIQSYGGKLVENIVQAVSRDVLVDSMKRMSHLDLVMHVHDETVVESDQDIADLVNRIMETPLPWAPGLPLKAQTFVAEYYQK